jgi:hypothetical protein
MRNKSHIICMYLSKSIVIQNVKFMYRALFKVRLFELVYAAYVQSSSIPIRINQRRTIKSDAIPSRLAKEKILH